MSKYHTDTLNDAVTALLKEVEQERMHANAARLRAGHESSPLDQSCHLAAAVVHTNRIVGLERSIRVLQRMRDQ